MKVAVVIACDLFTQQSYGGKQCALSHVTLLQSIYGKENVRVFSFSVNKPDHVPENFFVYSTPKSNLQVAFLALRLRKVMGAGPEKEMMRELEAFQPDLLWVDSSQLGRLLRRKWKIPTVVFFHNMEQLYAKNKVLHQSVVYLPSYWASTYNESVAVRKSDRCICLNERDGKLLHKLYNRTPEFYLPIYFEDTVGNREQQKEKKVPAKNLLFVGSKFPPNVQGITWFVENVMPKLPEFHLKIVGRDFETLRDQLTRDNVEVVGGVTDLSRYYMDAAAMVMPILYGDGMKVKTAEAMMYGKMIFASPEALVGYDALDVPEIFLCENAEDFEKKIRSALSEKQETLTCHDDVRDFFVEHYTLDAQKTRLESFIKELMQQHSF